MSESICHECRHFNPISTGVYECRRYSGVRTDGVRECEAFEPDDAVSRIMQPDTSPTTADLIRQECAALCAMLLEKNAKYGDSALSPIRCFSRADPLEQIRVRLDDKLSRLMRGQGIEDEDVELDLMGYLVLLRVARQMNVEYPPLQSKQE
jgi:hypothetical protein